jgi:hypothetical protein
VLEADDVDSGVMAEPGAKQSLLRRKRNAHAVQPVAEADADSDDTSRGDESTPAKDSAPA